MLLPSGGGAQKAEFGRKLNKRADNGRPMCCTRLWEAQRPPRADRHRSEALDGESGPCLWCVASQPSRKLLLLYCSLLSPCIQCLDLPFKRAEGVLHSLTHEPQGQASEPQ